MTRFYLIRHGEAYYDLAEARQLIGGMRELVPLTERGRAQIESLSGELGEVEAGLIIASPMTRALQSAAILSRALDLPLRVEYDLHEWMPDSTFRYDRSATVYQACDEMMGLGGEWPADEKKEWEPLSALRRRVLAVLGRYGHLERALVVCHALVIHSLVGETVEVGQYRTYQMPEAG